MITINDKSSRTPIFIERDILNKNEKPSNDYVNSDELDEILTGYITEDELQEILKEYNNVPYLFIRNDGDIISGDFDTVYDAISNKQPYLIYVYTFSNTGLFYSPAESVVLVAENGIGCAYDFTYIVNGETRILYRHLSIYKNGAIVDIEEERKIPTEFKTINSNSILGSGNITVQPSLVSGTNIKTINGSSLLGSGDITIVGSGSEILYLYKSTDDTAASTHKNHNINIRNKILSLTSTEQYPIIILKDWYNDTICNNVYAKDGYVEIQCCNSRIFGEYSELTDERYELNNKGVLVKLEGNTFASKAYVDEQVSNVSGGGGSTDLSNYYTKGEIDNMVGDIETILDNLIGNN